MGASGSKNHRSPSKHYQRGTTATAMASRHPAAYPSRRQTLEEDRIRMMIQQQNQYRNRHRSRVNYDVGTEDSGIATNGYPLRRSLRPILAPQSTQTLQRPRLGDGAHSQMMGTMQKNPNRVTFGSTSAISRLQNVDDSPFGDANTVFTRSKDNNRASQVAVNVSQRQAQQHRQQQQQHAYTMDRRSMANMNRTATVVV